MHAITTRRLRAEDATLAAEALSTLKPSVERESRPAGEAWCQSFFREERNILIVALSDAEPIGYTIAYLLDRADRPSPMLLLYDIEVAKTHRKLGIGRAMIERLKAIAQEHDAYKMWVLTDSANRAGRVLYRSCGGTESGENLLIEWTGSDLEVQASDASSSVPDAPAPSATS